MRVTIGELKQQRRWVLWRLETVNGKPTKVPYQPSGYKASIVNPTHLHTFSELEPHVPNFSGLGLVLGNIGGVSIVGVDIDACCDAHSGKFSPESREVVIGLDSYGEFSPSGTGCHVWCLAEMPGKGLQKPYPGAKQVEVKGDGYYHTFTGRHLGKTPATLEDRQEQVNALYARVSAMSPPKTAGLTVSIPISEQERFERLIRGDMSAYNGDHSAADFALCILLAKRHACNAFAIEEEFNKSALCRDKWLERDDYRQTTITKAIMAVAKEMPVIFSEPEDAMTEDDGVTEWIVEPEEGRREGWFPKREVSLIGGPSGAGKTSWAFPLLDKASQGAEVWGHKTKPRNYRVLLHDRSKQGMKRTADALGLKGEALARVIRLTTEQQRAQPHEVLEACIAQNPGVEVWFIEGLDFWVPDMMKADRVAPVLDALQRVASRGNVAVLATVGAPKQRGKDRYFGRDSLFGSQALGRKCETVVLISWADESDYNSARRCTVLPRNDRAEDFYFTWAPDGGIVQVEKPQEEDRSSAARMLSAVRSMFKPDEPIVWRPSLGPETSFYRWRKAAKAEGWITEVKGKFYLRPGGVVRTEGASS